MSFFGELKRYLDADTLCRMYYCGDHEVFEFYKVQFTRDYTG